MGEYLREHVLKIGYLFVRYRFNAAGPESGTSPSESHDVSSMEVEENGISQTTNANSDLDTPKSNPLKWTVSVCVRKAWRLARKICEVELTDVFWWFFFSGFGRMRFH